MKKFLFISCCVIFSCSICSAQEDNMLKITSPSFNSNAMIPKQFTCQGKDINPQLDIDNIPAGTKSLALIVDDPDAPRGTWVHWVVYNIGITDKIEEGTRATGVQAVNDFRQKEYGGPCPPYGTHRYFFKLYALDTLLPEGQIVDKADLEAAMEGHIIEQSELVGIYKKY